MMLIGSIGQEFGTGQSTFYCFCLKMFAAHLGRLKVGDGIIWRHLHLHIWQLMVVVG